MKIPSSSTAHRTLAVAALLLAVTACSSSANGPTLVCITHVGDDGLTNRIVEELEARIREEQGWELGGCSLNDSLLVHVPAPQWSKDDTRIEVRLIVAIKKNRHADEVTVRARCMDDGLRACSDVVIERLRKL